jgi:hypothetical protein
MKKIDFDSPYSFPPLQDLFCGEYIEVVKYRLNKPASFIKNVPKGSWMCWQRKTTCTNQKDEVVVDGTAWSMPPQIG